MLAAWYFSDSIDTRERVLVEGKKLMVADGDSFSIGTRKLRLDGIDAPEYRQSCNDADGTPWECGKASRSALEHMLREPGLACVAGAKDRYARSIATCSTNRMPDIAAAQVRAGMAVSDEFYGMQTYGDEEDEARVAKRGLWIGEFLRPDEWRAANAS